MNLLDRAIELLAPRTALRRAGARQRLAALERVNLGFDAADRGRLTASWRSANAGSANAETLRGLPLIRHRCRDLVRNDGWATQAIRRMVTLLVGTGFHPKLSGQVADAWRRWSRSKQCDHLARHTFRALQSNAVRGWQESGESFVVRRIDRSLEIPLRIQLLEADYLDDTRNEELKDGGRIVQGVEYDAEGRRRAYWFFNQHPGEPGARPTSKPVAAADVAHLYAEERTGQARGLPRLVPCVLKLRDLGDFTEAQLIRQKIAASICYFEIDSDPDAQGPETGTDGTPPTREVQPGTIERLGPGRRIEAPLKIELGDFRDFGTFTLFEIAAGAGMPYEILSGDLVNVNFSSAKIGQAPFFAEIDQLREFVIVEHLLSVVLEWFIDAGRMAGRPGFAAADRSATWQPPRRLQMDPQKENEADKEAVRAGFKTLTEVLIERGRNRDEHLDEYSDDIEAIDARELAFDMDARRSTPAGASPVAEPAKADAPDGGAGPDDDEEEQP